MERRDFFKSGIAATAAWVLSSSFFGKAQAADAPPPGPLLSESDPTAQALGFRRDAKKVDVKKWAKKAGPDGKTQKCASCMFYTALDGKHGKCQIFPNNTVPNGGWCNTWTKKA